MCAVATAGAASPPITPTPHPRDRGDITTESVLVPSSPPWGGPSRPCLATVLREPAATTTQSLDSAASAADTAEAADPSAPCVPGPPRRRQPDALFKAAGGRARCQCHGTQANAGGAAENTTDATDEQRVAEAHMSKARVWMHLLTS